MLITPISPKVTARPRAARRSTLPRLRPLKSSPTISARLSEASTLPVASFSAASTAGSLSTASRCAKSRLLVDPGTRRSCCAAAIRRAGSDAESASIACVVSRTSRTSLSCSFVRAPSTAGRTSGSGACCSERAASRRSARSGAESESTTSARSSVRRRRLLITTFSRSSRDAAGAPVRASRSLPPSSMRTGPSGPA